MIRNDGFEHVQLLFSEMAIAQASILSVQSHTCGVLIFNSPDKNKSHVGNPKAMETFAELWKVLSEMQREQRANQVLEQTHDCILSGSQVKECMRVRWFEKM